MTDGYDKLRDDRLDFPPEDDREREEQARYDALGGAESDSERTHRVG